MSLKKKAKATKVPKGARWFGLREDESYPVYSLSAGRDFWLTRAEVRRIELAEKEYEACQKLMSDRYDTAPAVRARAAAARAAREAEARPAWARGSTS